ncbi:MAG: flavin-dependent thymidylate synthase [Candidatus Woesearchaeota archaeon]|nr:MAG: flavin-dependent thymidylate synthase [Candidatus Woesearchaeota archaeon]
MDVKLIDCMGDDLRVVNCARVSFNKFDDNRNPEKLIKYLMEHDHMSPFEHVVFTIMVECPIAIARQFMRHRTFSYSEISRRYTSEDIRFYLPEKLRLQSKINKQGSDSFLEDDKDDFLGKIKLLYDEIYSLYYEMIESNIARELARFILPVSTYTKFIFTGKLRNIFDFLELRLAEDSQYEIRVISNKISAIIKEKVPLCYNAWQNKMESKFLYTKGRTIKWE